MPTAKMLMIVPEMIWSACTVIDSHAWARLTSIAAATAAASPMRSGAEIPSGPIVPAGTSWALIDAVHHATKAAVSIIPSMPMLTTPERSFMNPQRAPRAIAVASADDRRRDDRHDLDQVPDELEDIADDGQAVQELHRSTSPSARRTSA